MSILTLVITFPCSLFKSQRQLDLENLALRQQVTIHTMLRQSVKRHRATAYGWPNPYPLSIPGSTKQPDAPDNPTPGHPPQALPPHLQRRVARFVGQNWSFYPPGITHTFIRIWQYICAGKLGIFIKARSGLLHISFDKPARCSKLTVCGVLCPRALPDTCLGQFAQQLTLKSRGRVY
jgi:hypothetical protein